MPKKRMPGLYLKDGIWQIDKYYKYFPGRRLRQSTGYSEAELDRAEAYLRREMEQARKAVEEGVRPVRTFKQAATKYLNENTHKASIKIDAWHPEWLVKFIGDLPLSQVHDDTLRPFIRARRQAGVKKKSINNGLQVARRILNLAARSWRHNLANGQSMTWLETAPLITMLRVNDAAKPYPLSWEEQERLFSCLHKDLADMCLFMVNTGTRQQEICQLEWQWEIPLPELQTSVFLVPAWVWREHDWEPEGVVKNREDRLVVLNRKAQAVIECRRGIHQDYVFTVKGKPVTNMNNTAWQSAWRRAELPVCKEFLRGVHNLKHTFGRRLEGADVPYHLRQVLLGHKTKDVTEHYSAVQIERLLDAANSILENPHDSPTVAIVKRRSFRNERS